MSKRQISIAWKNPPARRFLPNANLSIRKATSEFLRLTNCARATTTRRTADLHDEPRCRGAMAGDAQSRNRHPAPDRLISPTRWLWARDLAAAADASRSCLRDARNGRSRELGLDLAHEALHRLEQLVEAAVAVEVDL